MWLRQVRISSSSSGRVPEDTAQVPHRHDMARGHRAEHTPSHSTYVPPEQAGRSRREAVESGDARVRWLSSGRLACW